MTGRYRKGRADCEAEIERLTAWNERLRAPWSAVDDQDWQYLASLIPDGGRGRFWKAVLGEMRAALVDEQQASKTEG